MRPARPDLTPLRIAAAFAAVGAVAAPRLPVVRPSTKPILIGVAAKAIAALGLDILVGRTGQLSLAHAAFLGVGAFTAVNVGGRGAPWPVAVLAAVGSAAAVATVAGLPSLRIRGLQVAIVTLAFQVAAEKFAFTRTAFTGADKVFDRPALLQSNDSLYLFALVCVAGVLVVRARLGATKAGRALLAVRDVELRASSFGVDPGSTKLLAYTISGAVVGLAGALLALKESPGAISDISPFKLLESLLLVAVVVVGGAESGAGILVAAVFLRGVPQVFTGLGRDAPLVSALLLVVAIVVQPTGIGGIIARADVLLDRGRRRRERPSPRPRLVALAEVAADAVGLRDVPRGLSLRLPVRALLEAEHVTVQYGGVRALHDLSLEVRRGEVVGLIGANGAGKSTFFNACSGYAPTTGSIRFRGLELLGAPPARRTSFGLARTFQDMGLVRAETVRENVLLSQTWLARYPAAAGILALGATTASERDLRRRADAALRLFGLDHLAHERLGELPYGTARIVEIAAAVAAGPDVLLLDEATAGLGPEESLALGDRFLALRDELGLTLVVIEHHVPLIARVCDYCYCLESGEMIAEGTPADVTAEPRVVESFLGRGAATGARA